MIQNIAPYVVTRARFGPFAMEIHLQQLSAFSYIEPLMTFFPAGPDKTTRTQLFCAAISLIFRCWQLVCIPSGMTNETRVDGEGTMSNSRDDRWKELCEAIMREVDSKRLMELVEKLNRTLEERERESDS
jgi:hypothetical protein